jgi:ubiquinone biosynthesis UbiH/UbiF/VisC/COQ6 family hydroxylase
MSAPNSQHHDICIQGSGIVARTLALLLARERFRVALVSEAKAESGSGERADVRAYALNSASKNLLESLRVWPDAAHATPVLGMQVHGDTTGRVNFSAAEHGSEALAWIVDVPALEAQLLQAVKYQPLITVVEQVASAHLQDSTSTIRRDLTVICEGKNSMTRDQLGVEFDVTPYRQQAIAARLTGTMPHDNQALQWFKNGSDDNGNSNGNGNGNEILAFLPLSEPNQPHPGNSVALVWSVSEDRAEELMALSDDEFAAEVSTHSERALGDMTLYSERARWPLQLAKAGKWIGKQADLGSWALAGDAAHTVHPLSGQGLNLGLADAAELAKILGAKEYWRSVGDLKLLRRYERARKLDALALGTVTDGLQQLFARSESPLQVLRNWGMLGFERSGGLKQWVTKRAMGL